MLGAPGVFSSFALGVVAAFILTPAAVLLARKKGLCDSPDAEGLKIHRGAMPVIGGCAVFLALAGALLPLFVREGGAPRGLAVIAGCALFLVVLGVVDDLHELSPGIRFLGHLMVGVALSLGGVRIGSLPGEALNVACTVVVVVGLINALNLLDGMDGLASGVASVSSLGFLGLFMLQQNPYGVVAAALLGALLGFLPYNVHPARIFLGDNGSTLIGFLLAVLAISVSSGPSVAPLFASLAIVSVPVFDTGWAIVRRVRGGRSLFIGDREHFYDRLLRRGLTQRQVAAVGYGLSFAGSIAGWSLYLLCAP
ncbi:undecaprenyl/decaprenyl-phosphate alpha-N-acetylglucosaminyl 1-phosphate transferase [Geomonas sp. RF6]|uniref:MraY family glycosyltransferase n=1 Tax=Geomonas sp. RF6 TaxID=2897342 RepID=UPI001E2CFE83|nr:MraY family glycosyltransferase [Geomonas sp. RF6]UFS69339.1 undecaprenyl/decaprenyl-phosphate alpha-N-acetylglucosaminyl 1-phosphate transferase [Geomonas sp. RF6]